MPQNYDKHFEKAKKAEHDRTIHPTSKYVQTKARSAYSAALHKAKKSGIERGDDRHPVNKVWEHERIMRNKK